MNPYVLLTLCCTSHHQPSLFLHLFACVPPPPPHTQAGSALQPYGEVMSKVLARAIDNVAEAVLRSCGSNAAAACGQQQLQQQQTAPGLLGQQPQRQQQLASETTQEGLAAAALVDVMLQVGDG